MVAILSKFSVLCLSYFIVYFLKSKLILFYNSAVYHYTRIFLNFLLSLYMNVCVCVCVNIYIYIYKKSQQCVCVRVCVCVCVCIYIYIYIYIYMIFYISCTSCNKNNSCAANKVKVGTLDSPLKKHKSISSCFSYG